MAVGAIINVVLFVTVSFCCKCCPSPVGVYLRWCTWCGISPYAMLESSLLPAPLFFESAIHVSVFGKREAIWLPLSRAFWRAA